MKINEQIVFLRKQKNMTQEQLATVLGVTNQSVSKWESGQCCPDIALLPDIAGYFGVSIDELMGVETAKKDNKRTSDEDENMYDRMSKTPMLIQAFLIATNEGGVSTSILQRRLLIGYDRAKALVEELIVLGFVEEQNKNGLHRITVKQGIPGPLAYDMQAGITSKIKSLPLVDARRFMLAMAFSGHVSYFYATQNGSRTSTAPRRRCWEARADIPPSASLSLRRSCAGSRCFTPKIQLWILTMAELCEPAIF